MTDYQAGHDAGYRAFEAHRRRFQGKGPEYARGWRHGWRDAALDERGAMRDWPVFRAARGATRRRHAPDVQVWFADDPDLGDQLAVRGVRA